MNASEPITEDWLLSVGFKWHQFDRQPTKQWLLWLGWGLREDGAFTGPEDLGIELSVTTVGDHCGETWHCWLRSDVAHRYSRFVHVRHLSAQADVVRLIEALTGYAFSADNVRYGQLLTPERAERFRKEDERLDQRLMRASPWSSIERDPTIGGALPEHAEAYERARKGRPE